MGGLRHNGGMSGLIGWGRIHGYFLRLRRFFRRASWGFAGVVQSLFSRGFFLRRGVVLTCGFVVGALRLGRRRWLDRRRLVRGFVRTVLVLFLHGKIFGGLLLRSFRF